MVAKSVRYSWTGVVNAGSSSISLQGLQDFKPYSFSGVELVQMVRNVESPAAVHAYRPSGFL